jgi:oxygen-independent coproporphyrinogen-3 oxidase
MSLPLNPRDDRDGAAPGTGTEAVAPPCDSPLHWLPGWAPGTTPLQSAWPSSAADSPQAHHGRALEALAGRPDEALSLALTIPFCATHCMCCPREIQAAQPSAVIDDYVSGLVAEIRTLAERIGSGRDVLQLHLGSGTANELNDRQLVRLVGELHQAWRLPADAEMSVDCDPRRAGWAQLRLLAGLGFSRVNFGVLDLDPEVQRAIGRRQSVALIDDVCGLARDSGIEYINLDLMVGLPQQTAQRWQTTLDRLLAMAPDRVRLTHYRHRPWQAPAQQTIDVEALPDAEQTLALARQTADTLCTAGYCWIGGDQFVLETDELARAVERRALRRSLIAYTAGPPTPLLGLGVGAVSEIDGSMFWNETALPQWHRQVQQGRLSVARAQPATPRERLRRAAVERLLCELELPAVATRGGLEDGYRKLAAQARHGLVRLLDDRIAVTEAGRHALTALCSELDDPRTPAAADPRRWLS